MASQYFDSENITESRLSFRRATSEPMTHGRDDAMCAKVLYDMDMWVISNIDAPPTQ